MAQVNLRAGHDVVIPQIIQTQELADSFHRIAKENNANYPEILLLTDKAEAIRRFIERGKSEGHPTGFRAGGITDTGGREKKLAEMYDHMLVVAASKKDIITIEPVLGDIEHTYTEILKKLG